MLVLFKQTQPLKYNISEALCCMSPTHELDDRRSSSQNFFKEITKQKIRVILFPYQGYLAICIVKLDGAMDFSLYVTQQVVFVSKHTNPTGTTITTDMKLVHFIHPLCAGVLIDVICHIIQSAYNFIKALALISFKNPNYPHIQNVFRSMSLYYNTQQLF